MTRTPDLPSFDALSEVLGNSTVSGIKRTGRQTMTSLAYQLIGTGPLAEALSGFGAGLVDSVTWAGAGGLSTIPGTRAGQPGRVKGPDAGTHTDPVLGGTVANVGEYVWSDSPAGWRRTGALSVVAAGSLALDRLVNVAEASVLLRAAGAGSGPPVAGTAAQMKTILGMSGYEKTAATITVTSAAIDLGAADGQTVYLAGSEFNITSLGAATPSGIWRFVILPTGLTLVHNATSLRLPGNQNIPTLSQDRALFLSLGGGNWSCLFYQRFGDIALKGMIDAEAAARAAADTALANAIALKADASSVTALSEFVALLDAAVVKRTGNQVIEGIKTFSAPPMVPDESFTLAKLQHISTGHLLGRQSTGTGAVQQVVVAGSLDLSNGALRRAALIGDVTAPLGSNELTIPAGTVTNAKAADMPSGTMKLRPVGTAGPATDATFANVVEALGINEKVDFNGRAHRPGDAPLSYTTSLTEGDPASLAPLFPADTITDEDGRVVRIVGVGLVAQRDMWAIEDARVYQVRAVLRRRVNTPDPSNDSVRVGIAWYDRNRNRLVGSGASTIVTTINDLTVASGRTEIVSTVSRASGAATLTAPAGALYGRIWAQTFGSDSHQTDVEVLGELDTTDLTAWDPDVTAFNSRLIALESLDIGDRLAALETAIDAPEVLRFQTETEAAAATIAAYVDYIEVLGEADVADSRPAVFERSGTSPTDGFTSADGAHWEKVTNFLTRENTSPAWGFQAQSDAEAASVAPDVDYIDVSGVVFRRVNATHPRLGPNIARNGKFTNGAGLTLGTGWSVSGGRLVGTAGSASNAVQDPVSVNVIGADEPYFVSFDAIVTAGSIAVYLGEVAGPTGTTAITATGTVGQVVTSGADGDIYVRKDAAGAGSIDELEVKRLPAEAFQSADGAWWAWPAAEEKLGQLGYQRDIVLLMTGQSNASGAGTGGDMSLNPNVLAWDHAASTWVVADPMKAPYTTADTNNAGFHAAKEIQETRGGIVRIFNINQGATSIDQWMAPSGTVWARLNVEIEAGLAACGLSYLDRIMYIQGESDQGKRCLVFVSQLRTLMNQLKAKSFWKRGHTYVVATELVEDAFNASRGQELALRLFSEAEPEFAVISTWDLLGDITRIHFDGPELEKLGERLGRYMMLPYAPPTTTTRTRHATGEVYFEIGPDSTSDFTDFVKAIMFFSTISFGYRAHAFVTIKAGDYTSTPATATGIRPNLQQGERWHFTGELAGGFTKPVKADFSGVQADDLNVLKTKYLTRFAMDNYSFILGGGNAGSWKNVLFTPINARPGEAGIKAIDAIYPDQSIAGGTIRMSNCVLFGWVGGSGLNLADGAYVKFDDGIIGYCSRGIQISKSRVDMQNCLMLYNTIHDINAVEQSSVDARNMKTTRAANTGNFSLGQYSYADARGAEGVTSPTLVNSAAVIT